MSFDPSKIPLASPPHGVSPNFIHPESRAWQLYLTVAICATLAISFVLLRMYFKFVLLKLKTLDDYVMVVAILLFCAYCGIVIAEAHGGYGHHMWDLTLASISNRTELIVLVSNCLYGPILSIVKISLFLLILHIFKTLRWLRVLVYIGLLTNVAFYFSGMGVFIALCAPKAGQDYAETFRTERCRKSTVFGIVQGVFGIVSDFYLLVIPIPAVMGLQMPRRRKLGVIAIFMTGLLACITSCLSLWVRIALESSNDVIWDTINPLLLAVIEMAIGIIVACMPSIAALVRQKGFPFSKLFASLRSSLTFARFPKRSSSRKILAYRSGDFKRLDPSLQTKDIRLETRILGSARGAGKFLDSDVDAQERWSPDAGLGQTHAPSTVREQWQ